VYAPAIVRAEAFWHGAQVASNTFIGNLEKITAPNLTQVKPQGIPTINWNHPLTNGLLVDLFDLGYGQYINLCNGNIPQSHPSGSSPGSGLPKNLINGSTGYGTATFWPGIVASSGFAQPGTGALVKLLDDHSIENANSLTLLPIGAGNTLATGCLWAGPGTGNDIAPWIFGRTGISAGETGPPADWAFYQTGVGTGAMGAFTLNPSASQVQVGSNYTLVSGAYTTLLMTCQNTSASPGTGTAYFSANGVANGNTTGVSMYAYPTNNFPEIDLQIGATYHSDTTGSQKTFLGYIYWGRVWARSLSPIDWMYLHNHPYSIYL
jgi:hypothetical protein